MMDNYRLSAEAERDVARIWNYLQETSGERTANRMVARFIETFELLAEYPYMGSPRDYIPGIRSHAAPNTRYVVLYFPDSRPIEIARVVHGSRDIERLFEQSS